MPVPAAVGAELPPIRKIGSASLLDSVSPLRWGSISVGSVEFGEVVSDFYPQIGPSHQDVASIMRAHIIYDREFRQSRLALQYQPRVAVVNGRAISNYLNQNLVASTSFVLGPRWSMGLADQFNYYKTQSVFGDVFLDADSTSATTIQNRFIDGPGSWLSNGINADFGYLASPRTHLTLSEGFIYNESNGVSVSPGGISSRNYNSNVSLTHDITQRMNVGAFYSFQLSQFSKSFSSTVFQTFGGSYSQMLGNSWGFRGTIGASTAGYLSARQWTLSGSVGITKAFHRSTAALAYSRGETLTGYISNHYGDRIDLSYSAYLSRRLRASAGAGYQRDITQPSNLWAKYVSSQVSYQFLSRVSLFASYIYKWQRGDASQVFVGNRAVFQTGLRWDSARADR